VLHDFLSFEGPVRLTPALREASRAITVAKTAPLGEQVAAIGSYLHGEFGYRQHVTRYDSTTDDFLEARAGVCQDFAHLAHNTAPDERYVVVGHGRSYDDVPPNRGIFRGVAKETLAAEVRTERARGRAGAAFQEDILAIDLPVFTEVPQRRTERPPTPEDAAAEAQQQ
jgi:transglutaminase-like putative cysteine protease